MGQKVNPTIFRISNRRSWFSLWNVNKPNYGSTLFNDFELRFYLDIIFRFFGIFKSNPLIFKSTKNFRIYSKLVESNDFSGIKLALSSKKKQHLDHKRENLRFFSNFSNTFLFEVFKYRKPFLRESLLHTKLKKFLKHFYIPFISAQIIADFIAMQLMESHKNKEIGFKRNIRNGIFKIVKKCFNKKTIPFISGIKISCSGRWMKTANGRAQALTYSLGKIDNQVISSFLDYGFSKATTSFGSCNIKVIICYRKVK